MNKLIIEKGSCDIFGEMHDIDPSERKATHECGSKCLHRIFCTEQILRLVEVI